MAVYAQRLMFSALFVAAYALVMSLFGIGCPFRALGMPSCPTCGLTRAYVCLFSGDIVGAYRNHPLFGLVPVVWLLACVDQNATSLRARLWINGVLVAIGVAFLVRWLTLVVGV